MEVTLTRDEMLFAGLGGLKRRVDAIDKGRTAFFDGGSLLEHDVYGAMAEAAVAKALRQWWFPVYDNPSGVVDVGSDVEVRHTRHPNGNLIVYKKDPDDDGHVLGIPDPPVFKIVGWKYGRDAKHAMFWKQDGKTYPAYWVPQGELEDFRPGRKVRAA